MGWKTAVALVSLALAAGAADKTPGAYRFGKEDAGKLPAGWKAAQTGEGKSGVWKVVADPTAPSGSGHVLAQTTAAPSRVFNLCVAEKARHKGVDIAVKFKAVKGKIDQGGGVAWRYQDADNYYVCRYNPLEDNLRVYKVVKGRRMQLGTKEELPLPAGKWHTLEVTQTGERITCKLNGKTYLDVKDGTIDEAGKVALWTKADAQTSFDDLVVRGK